MQDAAPARVLVVDDDDALSRLVELTLVTEGFEVEVAADGIAGLEALRRGSFHALVLDLQMPGMDGRAMYREMRAQGHAVPTLVLSAYGAEAARADLGADAAISKPFDIDELLSTIRKIGRLSPPGP